MAKVFMQGNQAMAESAIRCRVQVVFWLSHYSLQ